MAARAVIAVRAAGGSTYEVTVSEAGGETRHRVTASSDVVDRLARGRPAEVLIDAAFRFLLDREPKEAILDRFELPAISRYFPDFEDRLPRYLDEAGR